MVQNFCDICGVPIPIGEYKYMLYQQELLINPKQSINQEEFIKRYKQSSEEVVIKEICSECKQLYDHIFSLRIAKINKIKKEIEKSYYAKPEENIDYCNCEEFIDEGEMTNGDENGICYICGKLQKSLSANELKKLIEKEEY